MIKCHKHTHTDILCITCTTVQNFSATFFFLHTGVREDGVVYLLFAFGGHGEKTCFLYDVCIVPVVSDTASVVSCSVCQYTPGQRQG